MSPRGAAEIGGAGVENRQRVAGNGDDAGKLVAGGRKELLPFGPRPVSAPIGDQVLQVGEREPQRRPSSSSSAGQA